VDNVVSIEKLETSRAIGGIQVKTLDDLSRLSKMLAASGFFEDCKQAAQAGVKVICGIEMGFPAFASMTGIYIIKGKPAIGANLMAAAVKRSDKYNYRIVEHSDQCCKIAFLEHGEQIGVSEFTSQDAARGGTQNMGKFPRNMLFARAMSNGVKWFCPDIFLGSPVYTPEELGATIDEENRVSELSTTQVIDESEAQPMAKAIPEHPTQVMAATPEVWRKWKTPTDALAWGATILPDLTPGELQKLFDSMLAVNGKKAPAFVQKVLEMAITF